MIQELERMVGRTVP